jgi:hypothetical protein
MTPLCWLVIPARRLVAKKNQICFSKEEQDFETGRSASCSSALKQFLRARAKEDLRWRFS